MKIVRNIEQKRKGTWQGKTLCRVEKGPKNTKKKRRGGGGGWGDFQLLFSIRLVGDDSN